MANTGLEGLRSYVSRNRLAQLGARRFEGSVERDGVVVMVSIALELHHGQLEAVLRVSPRTPPNGLFACARAHWLGSPETHETTPTGDAALDAELALVLPEPTLLGLFDEDTRAALRLALASGETTLEDGVFVGRLAVHRHGASVLDDLCVRLVSLATALSAPPKTWLERTLSLAFRDLDPDVRRQTLAHLESSPALHSELELYRMKLGPTNVEGATVESLLTVLSSPTLEPPSRAAALPRLISHLSIAEVLERAGAERDLWGPLSHYGGGEGFDTLMLELERALTPVRMHDEAEATFGLLELLWPYAQRSRHKTAIAFSRIIRNLGHPGALDMVSLLLETGDQTRFFAALDALLALTDEPDQLARRLGDNGISRVHSWLSEYFARRPRRPSDLILIKVALDHLSPVADESAEVLVLLELLATRIGAESEPILIEMLNHEHELVVYRAIMLLGEVGGRESQLALEPLTSGLFRPSQVKRLARASLARLHERLGPLQTGGLSLSDDLRGGGGLSLDDD